MMRSAVRPWTACALALFAVACAAPARPPVGPVDAPWAPPVSLSSEAYGKALAAFTATCPRLLAQPDVDTLWRDACAAANTVDPGSAESFFRSAFVLEAVDNGETGLTTAYYEPRLEGRRSPEGAFTEPLRARPPDLVTARELNPAATAPNVVYRRAPDGGLTPYPDRRAIRAENLGSPWAYVRIEDAVFLQIQGSGRVALPGGVESRAAFSVTNGQPWRSIVAILVERGALTAPRTSNADVKAWLAAADPATARDAVDDNPRYVFFAEQPIGDPQKGPIGAAGAPLIAGASIAADLSHHRMGEIYLIAPEGDGAPPAQFGVVQDVGAAILGPRRADLFAGTGPEAGDRAARTRHQSRWWRLTPRPGAFDP